MKNIYVGNLDSATTEGVIRSLFAPHGAVQRVKVMKDHGSGLSRGFGFVEMANAAEADTAITLLNGTDLGGRAITVKEARQKIDRSTGTLGAARTAVVSGSLLT